jgi:hypothetical protein
MPADGVRLRMPEKRCFGLSSSERAWGPQPHAVSQACAAFFVWLRRHAPNGRRPAGTLATER